MNAKTLWRIGGALGFLVLVAAGWFLLVSPALATIGTNDRLRADIERQNAALEQAVASIADVDVAALEAELADLQRAVPAATGEPELLRQILATASAAGVTLNSVTFENPATFAPVALPTPADVEASGLVGEVPLPVAAEDLQAAVDAGLLVVSISVQVAGDADQVLAFIDMLQGADRLMLAYRASAIGLGAAGGGGAGESAGVGIDLLAFVLPAP